MYSAADRAEPGDDEPTRVVPPRSEVVAFSGVEDERLFTELRSRLFSRDATLRIGRYRVVRRLGAGAMGEVHLAVDEALDRPIALKLVHAHLADPRSTERLRVEARALARLAHPHVVHVYEVGEHEGRTYLAMERIEGGSLREWLRASPRPGWARVLAAYVDAGRGLAAAHHAGVIHRDFKPDNVLRATDGRVAVVDFGLAALERGEGPPTVRAHGDEDGREEGSPTLTRGSEIAGTPAYMPPEQFRGRADARADQFALCVSLYEGLWGRRPFPRRTLAEVLDGRAEWEPVQPPRDEVPAWLWPILRRGLQADPERRWPSVDELLAAIDAGLRRRRRRRRWMASGLAALGVGLLSGVSVAWWSAAPGVDACATIEHELDDTWGPAARARLRQRFTKAAAAPSTAWLVDSEAPVVAALDGWRARWLEDRRGLCRARQGGDPVVLDRQGRCLERHRRATRALVDALLRGEPEVLREAPAAVQQLEDPQACAREARQGGPPEPPAAVAQDVQHVREQLALADAERLTGRLEAAWALAAPLEERAHALGHAPLSAEVALLLGRIALAAGRHAEGLERLEHAADTGEAAHHDHLVARSWQHMAMVTVTEAPQLEAGRRWLRRAEAASGRVGLDALTAARLDYIRGNLERLAERHDAAVEQLGRAEAALAQEGDLLHASYASTSLGLARLERGEADAALEAFERALAQRERVFGPRHPEVAMAAYNLGQAVLSPARADVDRGGLAGTLLRRAVEIWAGTDEAHAGRAAMALAQLELDAGRFERGLAHAREAEESFRRALDPDAIEHAEVAALRGTAEYFLGRPRPAITGLRRAVAGYAAVHGLDDVYTAYFRVMLGWSLLAAGEGAEARTELEAGRAAIEAHAGPGAEDSTDARLGLVAVELAEGRLDRAAARLAELGATPTGELDRVTFELLAGLLAVRREPGSPHGAAALRRAWAHARAASAGGARLAVRPQRRATPRRAWPPARAASGGEAMLAVLLDSLHASAVERRLVAS